MQQGFQLFVRRPAVNGNRSVRGDSDLKLVGLVVKGFCEIGVAIGEEVKALIGRPHPRADHVGAVRQEGAVDEKVRVPNQGGNISPVTSDIHKLLEVVPRERHHG